MCSSCYKPLSILALGGRKYLRNVQPSADSFFFFSSFFILFLGGSQKFDDLVVVVLLPGSWSNWVIDGLWRNISRGLRSQNAIKTSLFRNGSGAAIVAAFLTSLCSSSSQKMKFKPFEEMFVTEKICWEWLGRFGFEIWKVEELRLLLALPMCSSRIPSQPSIWCHFKIDNGIIDLKRGAASFSSRQKSIKMKEINLSSIRRNLMRTIIPSMDDNKGQKCQSGFLRDWTLIRFDSHKINYFSNCSKSQEIFFHEHNFIFSSICFVYKYCGRSRSQLCSKKLTWNPRTLCLLFDAKLRTK